MRNLHISSLLLIGFSILIANTTQAQQLATHWSVTDTGDYRVRNHMVVIPATAHRYYATRQFDDGHRLVHLDQNGNKVWAISARGGLYPNGIVYHRGKIFLMGTKAVVHSPITSVVRMYEEVGGVPRMVWEYEVSDEASPTRGQLIVADPMGDGIIFCSVVEPFSESPRILKTRRISAARAVVEYDDIILGPYAYGVWPTVYGIFADAAGNTYVTGTSDPVVRRSVEGYVNPCSQLITKFNYSGRVAWTVRQSEPGYNLAGRDIYADATHVYVLGRRIREHSNVPTPWTTDETTLMKLSATSGDAIRQVSMSARIPANPYRKSLLVDHATGQIFVGDDSTDPSQATVRAFNTELHELWSRNIPLTTGAHLESIISPSAGRLAVGVNDDATLPTRFVVTSMTFDNEQFDRFESPIGGITHMQADASGKIHIGGLMPAAISPYVRAFQQLHGYRSNYRIFPTDLYATPYVFAELLQSPGGGQHWGSVNLNWNCSSLPCTRSFMASMAAADANWKEIITKASTITLPQDNKYQTFRLSVQKKSAYNMLYEVDRSLVDNKVTSISLATDSNLGTLTVSSATEGSNIPLTLSLIGSTGKVVGELKTMAPGKQTFADRVSEPVSYIRVTAPPIAPEVSVFPNPSNGKFKISLGKSATFPAQLTIYNGQGNKVHQQTISSFDTDVVLNNPLPGLYIVNVAVDKLNVAKTLQIKY